MPKIFFLVEHLIVFSIFSVQQCKKVIKKNIDMDFIPEKKRRNGMHQRNAPN